MSQIHRRFTDEQVKVLFQGYCQGQLARIDLQELLGIGKSRFFALLKAYRQDPEAFTISYRRSARARLSPEVEERGLWVCGQASAGFRLAHIPTGSTTTMVLRTRFGLIKDLEKTWSM
jgi:hypothetical protein